jgi:hypothetical protein
MGKRHSAGPQPRGETGARSCGKTQRVACHFRRRLSSQPSPGAMLPSLHRRQAGFRRSFSLNGPRAAAQKPAVVRQRAPSCLTHGEQQRRQPRCRLSASIPSLVPRRWVRKLRHWALDCSQAVATSVFDLAFAKQKGFAETRLAAASHRLAMLLNGAGMVRDGCPGQNAHETIPGLVVQPRSPAAAQTHSRGMQDVDHSSRTTGAAGSHPTALIFPLNGILRNGILHSTKSRLAQRNAGHAFPRWRREPTDEDHRQLGWMRAWRQHEIQASCCCCCIGPQAGQRILTQDPALTPIEGGAGLCSRVTPYLQSHSSVI